MIGICVLSFPPRLRSIGCSLRFLLVMLGGTIGLLPCLPVFATAMPTVKQTQLARRLPTYQGRYTCPTELEPLTQTLLRDLPAYINRRYLRTVGLQTANTSSYAVIASQPELTPLPIESTEYSVPQDKNLHQVFFTVLERQYSDHQQTEFQHYHWLFLARTNQGWQVALMFSRLGAYPADRTSVLTPPKESSQSLTAQAIRTWLRDCQAGAIRP